MVGTKTILICDDEPAIRRIVCAKLEAAGYSVMEASDGQAGLELARSRTPDLVVSDLQMPVMDGLAMCTQLQGLPTMANVPVVLLTARGHMVPAADLTRTNIRQIMAKPFSARALLETVNRLLTEVGGESRAAA